MSGGSLKVMQKFLCIAMISALCLSLFSNCDKQKKTGHRLEGDWEPVTFGKTDWEGLTEYATSLSGTLTFYEYNSDSSDYSLKVTSDLVQSNGNIDQNGTYKIIEKGNYMYVSTIDAQGTLTSYTMYRILTLNSTDLQLEFTSADGYYHMMIFRKK